MLAFFREPKEAGADGFANPPLLLLLEGDAEVVERGVEETRLRKSVLFIVVKAYAVVIEDSCQKQAKDCGSKSHQMWKLNTA